MNILTAIKKQFLIFSLTFSLAQADEPGYVLQNGSGVTDSSKQCVRTAASNPESVPAECSNAPESVASQMTNPVRMKRLMDVPIYSALQQSRLMSRLKVVMN